MTCRLLAVSHRHRINTEKIQAPQPKNQKTRYISVEKKKLKISQPAIASSGRGTGRGHLEWSRPGKALDGSLYSSELTSFPTNFCHSTLILRRYGAVNDHCHQCADNIKNRRLNMPSQAQNDEFDLA
ncbi:hypothetical protein EVAR_40585_1 [Eumeta japonica]|uniref:Uncharacterized protein n=1 Tax=Eumeta variegata TaxID=151549 RepID=A0A4C1VZ95_EUMVA|nr:hypothetical protein EVAR_40585_1 [Eumeta japonica]